MASPEFNDINMLQDIKEIIFKIEFIELATLTAGKIEESYFWFHYRASSNALISV